MLKSRADELVRRLFQTREAFRGIEKSLEHFESDIKLMANDAEKIESENTQLKRQFEEMEKKHARELAEAAKK